MVVYTVWYTKITDEEVLVGLFSTREKAQKCIKGYTFWDQKAMRIEEETIQ